MSDQLRQMRLVKGAASVVCDKQPNSSNKRFCTAAANIEGHLIAVWSVWDSVGETADQQAEREGAAIRAFVLNGLGATENFPALLSAVCGLTQPNAPEGVRPNPCS
ncbi:hypothetical protein EV561_101793 [Rhizobium sp. BK376]|nr:hypothetical protein EV561_101793 [Rhizobium sp. BK376]